MVFKPYGSYLHLADQSSRTWANVNRHPGSRPPFRRSRHPINEMVTNGLSGPMPVKALRHHFREDEALPVLDSFPISMPSVGLRETSRSNRDRTASAIVR